MLEDRRGANEAEEEEDLVGVRRKSFVTIVECWDTTRKSVQIRHTRHVNTVLSLTTQ